MLKYPSNQTGRLLNQHITSYVRKNRVFVSFYIFWRNSAIFRASVHQYLKLTKI